MFRRSSLALVLAVGCTSSTGGDSVTDDGVLEAGSPTGSLTDSGSAPEERSDSASPVVPEGSALDSGTPVDSGGAPIRPIEDASTGDIVDAAPHTDAAAQSDGAPHVNTATDGSVGALDGAVERDAEVAPRLPLLDDPGQPFPTSFHDVGLYPVVGDFETVDERVIAYAPQHPLWSNGSLKKRYIALPEGMNIDSTDRWAWLFPEGTLLFKSFFFDGIVETRVLRYWDGQWDFAVYAWNETQTEATLSDMTQPIGVEAAAADGETFTHLIPSRRQCVRCHEAGLTGALGFSELQLNARTEEEGPSQLSEFAERGFFSDALPEQPLVVSEEDPLTAEVLGYLQGNCVHCHNGQDSDLNAFDMRPSVALDNLINQPTESSASASGTRVVPGDAASSIVFQAFSGETDNPDVQFMPNVGVQLRDSEMVELFREWINGLPPADPLPTEME